MMVMRMMILFVIAWISALFISDRLSNEEVSEYREFFSGIVDKVGFKSRSTAQGPLRDAPTAQPAFPAA